MTTSYFYDKCFFQAPPKYEFKYSIKDLKTGDKKEHAETGVGDNVKGHYSLSEPDGTIRVVKYTADKVNGFNAIVQRIGKAKHPVVTQKDENAGAIPVIQKPTAIPIVEKTVPETEISNEAESEVSYGGENENEVSGGYGKEDISVTYAKE